MIEDISFARKLSKAKENSPVISLDISNDDIIRFTKTNPGLKGKFKYTEGDKNIRLDTKASKLAFIKLLNDDYLWSELTFQNYDSIAKDRISSETLRVYTNFEACRLVLTHYSETKCYNLL